MSRINVNMSNVERTRERWYRSPRTWYLLALVATLGWIVGVRSLAGEEPAKPADDATGSEITAKEKTELLDLHNKARKDVGVEPVKWSAKLAKYAQEWADHVAESGELEHRPRTGEFAQKYGENIAFHSTVLKGGEAWYSEITSYEKGTPIPEDFASFKAGHYTQMVWRKTTQIGGGKATIKKGKYKGLIVLVFNYDPWGNFPGEKPF